MVYDCLSKENLLEVLKVIQQENEELKQNNEQLEMLIKHTDGLAKGKTEMYENMLKEERRKYKRLLKEYEVEKNENIYLRKLIEENCEIKK